MQAAPAASAQHIQPPPVPVPQPRAPRVPQHYMNPGAFQAGFGGHAFARPPASAFRRQYRAYSTAILEGQQGRTFNGGRANLMYGGKSEPAELWLFAPLWLTAFSGQSSCLRLHLTSSRAFRELASFERISSTPLGPDALPTHRQLDIEFPIDFEITNPALPDLNTHVGVLEFIAEEGTVNLPQWVRAPCFGPGLGSS